MSRIKKYTGRNLRRLIESIISEQDQPARPATDWNSYIAAGKTERSKEQRKLIKTYWSVAKDNAPIYEGSDYPTPDDYDEGFYGWVKWYKACVKNSKIHDLLGKTTAKQKSYIGVDEMIEVLVKIVDTNLVDQMVKDFEEADESFPEGFDAVVEFMPNFGDGKGVNLNSIDFTRMEPMSKVEMIKGIGELQKKHASMIASREKEGEANSGELDSAASRQTGLRSKKQVDKSSRANLDVGVVSAAGKGGQSIAGKLPVKPPKVEPPKISKKTNAEQAQLDYEDRYREETATKTEIKPTLEDAKRACGLIDRNATWVIRPNKDETQFYGVSNDAKPQVKESLSRGSLYRIRYHGRY